MKPIPQIDLRSICREPDKFRVEVRFLDAREPWLLLGRACLDKTGNPNYSPDQWTLTARVRPEKPGGRHPTDCDHDNVIACRLSLVGVAFRGVQNHGVWVEGYIDGSFDVNEKPTGFSVPDPGYDPFQDPKAAQCTIEHCVNTPVEDGGGPHLVLSRYCPPFNRPLYEAVRGKAVSIRFFTLADPV